MDNLQFYSLNVNGLRNRPKRQTVLSFFKKKAKGIVMLQETHTSLDMVGEWEKLSGARCLFSHGDTNSKGVAVLIYDVCVSVNKVISDPKGRYILLDVQCMDKSFIILNVYLPTKDKRQEQHACIDELSELLREYLDRTIILAGDMNLCLQPELDKCGGTAEPISENNVKLCSLLEYLELIDIWRVRNPELRKFTWRGKTRRGVTQSRLDYFFISASLANITESATIVPGVCSDHSLITLSLINQEQGKRGKGWWKFNACLLKDDEYVSAVRKCILDMKEYYADLEDKQLLWDYTKCSLRGMTQSYSIKKSRLARQTEINLVKAIEDKEDKLAHGQDVFSELDELKKQYDNIQIEKAGGAILRAKVDWAEYGEKCSKFFLQLEKQKQEVKHIKSLITENGEINNPVMILKEEKRFYSELYKETADRKDIHSECPFLTNNTALTTVSQEVAILCDESISLDECKKALGEMANNKSPGSDGFTVEFYKFFWDDIKELVFASFNQAFNKGELSIEQRRGVISLVPKKGKDNRYLKNWRPISLLNIDYKILTKVLSNRLQHALKEIISGDQTGYIKGRYIGENIRVIDDIVTYTTITNTEGYVVLLDFEKAFDMVNVDFLKASLRAHNFGPNFVKWIDILYTNINSCVMNNGHATEFFPVTRGIRQGCPISAMLFIIVVELLSSYIKNCPQVKGLCINNEIFTITQLADDTTLFLSDKESVIHAIGILDKFYESSGLRLNKLKCEVFLLGSCGQSNNTPVRIGGLKCISKSFKALGIYFCKSGSEATQKNFTDKLNSIQVTLNVWLQRNLSLKGKVMVLKNLVMPNLLYTCGNLFVPEDFVKQVQDMLFKFLWGYKPAKVKQDTIIADIQQGGLRMPLFAEVVKSTKVMWIKRLLTGQERKWKILSLILMNMSEFDLLCKNEPKFVSPKTIFYEQVLHAWFDFYSIPPKGSEEIQQEILWNNRFIIVDNKPIMKNSWLHKGILYVQDLLDVKGRILTLEGLKEKINIDVHFLEYMSVINAIPKQWRLELTNNASNFQYICSQDNRHFHMLQNLNSKKVYWMGIERFVKQPTAINHWISEFPFLHDDDFVDIFLLAHKTGDVKLQSFQYKILNRIFPCNYMLNKWGITGSVMCDYCNEIDTLEHYFFYCENCKDLWQHITSFLSNTLQVNIPLNIVDILFGISHRKTQDQTLNVINFIILHGKWFIYSCKKEVKTLSFTGLYKYLKSILKVEIERLTIMNKELVLRNEMHVIMNEL